MEQRSVQDVDVVIIGAGPAGLSTALHLVQRDAAWTQRMLIVEKEAHPRHKLCGGGVTRLGLSVLKELGFSFPLPIPQTQIEDARFVFRGRTVHVRARPQFTVFHRADFDACLAREARRRGVNLHEKQTVIALQIGESRMTLTTKEHIYRARVVVGADGSNGVTRRFFNQRVRSNQVARLLEVLHPAEESHALFTQRYALFDFTPMTDGLQGYAWSFPAWVQGEAVFNLGVYDARLARNRPKAPLLPILKDLGEKQGANALVQKPAGHPIHLFSPNNTFSMPNLILVGDAAGVDPLFGEGIAPSLAYGSVAAQAVEQAFASGDFSFSDYRQRVLRARVGRYLRLRWLVARICYPFSEHASFMHAVWSLGAVCARLWPPPENLY